MMILNNHDTFLPTSTAFKMYCNLVQFNVCGMHYSEQGEGCCKNLKGEGKKKIIEPCAILQQNRSLLLHS